MLRKEKYLSPGFSKSTLSSSVSQGVGAHPDTTGREAGYTLNRFPVNHKANTETNNHAHPHCVNSESPISLTCMFLDGGRKRQYP